MTNLPPGATTRRALATPPGFERTEFPAMGTTVTVLVPGFDRAAAASVEDLFATWESALSRFRPDSDLSRLNASAGRPARVPELLLDVVDVALRAAHATDGVFDPGLEPAMREIGYDRTFDEIEPDGPAPASRPGGAWRAIVIDRAAATVRLPAGCALDLGGIAKGMAVDAAVDGLVRQGVQSAVVEAGGDLAVHGLPPGARSWPVALEGLGGLREVAITSGALATSGISRRSWRRGGEDQHHLLDPRTGLPADNDLWSVTAAAVTCGQAEVAAKSAFVLGRDAGARFLAELGISALVVGRDGSEWLVGSWAGEPGSASRSTAAGRMVTILDAPAAVRSAAHRGLA